MAVTIRYPNGQAIRYNDANYVIWNIDGSASLTTRKESGYLVARVLPGSGATIEFSNPCEVSNPITDKESALNLLLKNVRQVKNGYALAELKRALAPFNARTHAWKDGQS